ncbi:MAG: TerB family tellurite resistance protein [Cytophagales bacterium]|jgi:uncharacterized tellurite resistance protein B-like protein|nr:TerB family tellurite resistance protein [Cytophagales bacterium]MCA6389549.1 TerB family tellurite resistance protein [Cytophagales bacterium]MCA6392673.1 TerB family tellurite resistance protein [Cytophagales bacterium]MCA6397495.1 TerB family tellurite resistance protein [Cytophagales bacterium]MCA6402080.1 TerB family tellurite resistance protein [Cytophagales bacterium]
MNLKDLLGAFSQGKSGAKSHMKNLIELAAVDGNFDEVEYDLLKSIARRNGIGEGQLKEIRKNPNLIKFEVPTDANEKFHQLYDLVHMMSIDTNVHSEELKLSHIFAVKFGYSRDKVKELVDTIQSNILHGQGYEEAMKRVTLLIS